MRLPTWVTGVASDEDYNKLPGVDGIDQSTYQIQGKDDFVSQMQSLLQNTAGLNQPKFEQELSASGQLMQYLQGVNAGTQETAADALLRKAGAQQAQAGQSAVLAARGSMSSPLAFRQIANNQQQAMGQMAGNLGIQKAQEQMASVGLLNATLQQRVATQQQTYMNALQNNMAQADLAKGIFSANQAQTGFNVQAAQNRQALEMYNRNQALDRLNQRAQGQQRLFGSILGAASAVGGAVLGGPIGAGIGKAIGGALGGAAPAMFDAGGGNMASAQDINIANGYGNYGK